MDKLYDMSAGYVKLNLDDMIKVAGTAVRNARTQMDRYMGEIDHTHYPGTPRDDYHANHHAQFTAGLLAKAAKEYQEAWELYFALVECKTRETVEIER